MGLGSPLGTLTVGAIRQQLGAAYEAGMQGQLDRLRAGMRGQVTEEDWEWLAQRAAKHEANARQRQSCLGYGELAGETLPGAGQTAGQRLVPSHVESLRGDIHAIRNLEPECSITES